ncbi:MAG: sulfatase-like hydrolase/transferase [Boseongicola sp. SB0675_bin_26]|nr:sulfatase-like hydrolase/transferase [Boseongicola sp. SB0675_bin_26]
MNAAPGNNFLIVISDEHRKDAMGCAGHPVVKTPNLDGLAGRGTIFENAYTPSPVCVPARAAMACGDYVHNIGCWDSATPYRGVPRSWMHKLRDGGVEVTSIGKLHFRSSEDDNGFSREILPMHVVGGVGWPAGLLREDPPDFESARELAADVGAGTSSYTDYDLEITQAACDWLLARGESAAPWATFVSLVSPHYPLVAPSEYYDLYDPEAVDFPIAYEHSLRPRHAELNNMARFFDYDRHFDRRKVREAKAAYYGLVSFMDDCVGRILSALDQSGQADNTVVVYVSDHGDMMGDHGLWTKQVMYEASAGIPMIVAGPGVPVGKRVGTGTSLVDLAATAVDVTAASDSSDVHCPGRSLRSIAGEKDDPNRTVFSEYHDGGSTTGSFMARWGNWKFVYYVGHDAQLFNLAQDPHELHDLAHDGVSDPVVMAAWREGESRLRAICDPEKVNARCFADQNRRIAELGGIEACRSAHAFNHTPTPGEQRALGEGSVS